MPSLSADDAYNIAINTVSNTDGVDETSKSLEKLGDTGDKTGEAFKRFSKVMAVGLAVAGAGLSVFAKSSNDFLVDFVQSSKKLGREIGTTTEEASRLVAAVKRMGITADDASQMFGIFSKKIVANTEEMTANRLAEDKLYIQIEQTKKQIAATVAEIQKHGDKTGILTLKLRDLNNTLATQQNELQRTGSSFDKLGISTKNAQGDQKDFNTILGEVADKFKAMPDGIDKTQIAMDLFGKSGKDMIKVLDLGSGGIQQLEKDADKLGLTLKAETIGKVAKFVESQKKLKENTDAVKIAIGQLTAPALTKLNEKMAELIQKFNESDSPMKKVVANVVAFGGPILGFASGALAAVSSLVQITAAGVSLATVGVIIAAVVVQILIFAAIAYLIYRNWDTLKNFFTVTLPAALETAFNWIKAKAIWLKDNFWSVVGEIIGFFVTLPYKLPLYVTEALIKIVSYILSFKWGAIFSGIWQGMQWVWDKVTGIVVNAWHFIHNLKWGELISGIAKSMVNGLIGIIEGALKGALRGLPGGIANKIHLPRFEHGVRNFGGGLAVVGDVGGRGGEIVDLPRGSNVYSNKESKGMMGGVTINGDIYLGDTGAVNQFFAKLDRDNQLAQRGLTTVKA